MPKKFPKIFTVIFLTLIILQTGAFVFFTLFHTPAKADAKWTNPTDNFFFTPFSTPEECPDDPTKTCVPWIGEYIGGIYNYAIGIVGILAAVVLMFGGVIWLTAGGSPERVKEAKAWIGASISGLVLMLCSYMILYQINPDLVKFNALKIKSVEKKETTVTTANGCAWKTLTSEEWIGELRIVNTKKCEDLGLIKQKDNLCGKKPLLFDTCCCAPCPNCVTLSIATKDGDQADATLAAKLQSVKNQGGTEWQVTEAYPPTVTHLDSCHNNGTCVDINFISKTTDPVEVKKLYDRFMAAGLKAVYEHPNCANYTQDPNKVNCKIYETTTSPSFHVEL